MIKTAVIGATGYSGLELVRILLNHPLAEISYLGGRRRAGVKISEVHPSLLGLCDKALLPIDAKKIAKSAEVAFLCRTRTYQKWYKVKHKDRDNIRKAVYGLPELCFSKIRRAKLIANPGCYPTGAVLAAAPLMTGKIIDKTRIIIDAKSGVTGAGKKLSEAAHYPECNEDITAYRIFSHRHTPEINQVLSKLAGQRIEVTFTPYLAPMDRGILTTVYFELKSPVDEAEIIHCYQTAYRGAPFVRIIKKGMSIRVKNVNFTNFCDIGVYAEGKKLIVISAIDNLVKGASGQAVQNMNIMFGIDETAGLMGARAGAGQ